MSQIRVEVVTNLRIVMDQAIQTIIASQPYLMVPHMESKVTSSKKEE